MRKPEHDDRLHNHHFELSLEPSMSQSPPHQHKYEGQTSFDVGHRHSLRGVTAPALDIPNHVHEYQGTTSFNDSHVHHFSGVTGPLILTPDGGHYHIIEGETNVNGLTTHTHNYMGTAK
ncbi:hypothetical protein GCM10011571_32560 [Marinithermofilum abyssi]|uniref:YmaF family protein n=1 Tax=Marinithermofilum abyssi TaxID=1571185 RepID=A0A8J2VKA7_9BACL|nr:YmaF family protein [Marinithermofilum abyssi]GGE27876.1 hypothetical protein GCM10011571_32560 [Marinithermofilum abyssi]